MQLPHYIQSYKGFPIWTFLEKGLATITHLEKLIIHIIIFIYYPIFSHNRYRPQFMIPIIHAPISCVDETQYSDINYPFPYFALQYYYHGMRSCIYDFDWSNFC